MPSISVGLRLTVNVSPSIGAITSETATFTFAEPVTYGQYANGNWWVLGPVTITSITPASTLHNGLNGNGTPYTNRTVHGTMVNPGNRSFATGGLLANNTTNTVQGWDSIGSSKPRVAYSAPANVDPGATGSPLVVTTGSVVKFVSKLSGLPNGAENRPAGLDVVVLTVVDSIPAADAIRPGVSRTSKVSPCRRSQFDLSVFQNLAPTANAPTYAQALDWVDRYIETSQPDSINNPVAKGINNHREYGREIGNDLHRALLCLHLSSFTAEQKLALLSHFAAIADDLVSRAEEGGITTGAGGGNQWKKPVIAVCAAALGANAPASWLTWLSFANRNVWAEDSQIFTVSGFDIALPRFTGDGRPRSPYTQQMLGSADWGEQPLTAPDRSGSNWNAVYRWTVGYSLIGGALAVELTTGAKALWDHPEFWRYMDTVFLRRNEAYLSDAPPVFVLEMLNAYRPAKTAPPAILDAGIRDTAIWVRFDQALNETAALPSTGSFTVNVNGSPVTVSSVSIWRQNLGLTLASPVIGNDTVTLSYTAGANPVRSVDGVNIANLTNYVLTNRTDKVGGPNTAYPVVRFAPGVVRGIGGTQRIAPANSQVGTWALLKFRFAALPVAASTIFGNNAGASPIQMVMNTNGTLDVRVRSSTGTIVARFTTPTLAINTDYDLVASYDMTQTPFSAGMNLSVNGTLVGSLNATAYTQGAILGWNINPGATQQVNHSSNWTWDMGAFWLDTANRVDLNVAANRALFTSVTGGNLDILTLGDGINGTRPDIFLVGNADQWNDGGGINRGTGNKFFVTSGVTSGLVTGVSGSEWI